MEMVIAGLMMLSVNGSPVNREFSYQFSVIECSKDIADASMAKVVVMVSEFSTGDVFVGNVDYDFSCFPIGNE